MTILRSALKALAVLLVGTWAVPAAAQAAQYCPKPVERGFRVFEFLNYAGRPDLRRYGMEPVTIVDRGIWAPGIPRTGRPDPALVRQRLAAIPDNGTPVILDFEDAGTVGNDRAAAAALGRLDRFITAFRAADPDRAFGFYTTLPTIDYWRAIEGPRSARYREWQRQNDRLRSLEPKVDALFPSAYTFYEDMDGWVAYATAQICEARRISNKPVYVFLWPEFHDGERPHRGERVPGPYWRLQLETVRQLADGVVLWGGYDLRHHRQTPWEPRQGWWIETVRFMERLRQER